MVGRTIEGRKETGGEEDGGGKSRAKTIARLQRKKKALNTSPTVRTSKNSSVLYYHSACTLRVEQLCSEERPAEKKD